MDLTQTPMPSRSGSFYLENDMSTRALVVLSGGQDSTTCLFWAKAAYDEVHAITFDYGQRHGVEIQSALNVAAMAGVRSHEVISVPDILRGTSPLVNDAVSVDEYRDAQSLPGGIEKTFVPMRNTLFLTIAANRAVVLGCSDIITGVGQEDYGGYPDCRRDFLMALQGAFNESLKDVADISILAPLLHLTKAQTVYMAHALGADCWSALALSHTCYKGETPPCGKCHACLLRAKGFSEAGYDDPLLTRYQGGDHVRD